MGLKLLPGEVKSQTASMISSLERQNDALESLLPNVIAFANESCLSGQAWTGVKNQLSGHQVFIRGLVCAHEEMIADCRSLESIAGDENLDQDQLEEEIARFEKLNDSYSSSEESYRNSARNTDNIFLKLYFNTTALMYQNMVNSTNQSITLLKEKLQKLFDINSSSAQLFTAAADLFQSVDQGLNDLTSSWSGSDFDISPSGTWRDKLEDRWQKREDINAAKYLLENGYTEEEIAVLIMSGVPLKEMQKAMESMSPEEKTAYKDYFEYELSLSALVREAKIDGKVSFDPEKGDIFIKGEAGASFSLLSASASGSYGFASGEASATLGTVGVKGSAAFSLMEDGKFDPKIILEAKAYAEGLSGELSGQLGTEDYNIHGSCGGTVGKAEASAELKASLEDGSLYAGLGAEATALSGEVSGGFTVFGITIDATVEGKLASVGAKAEIGLDDDSFDISLDGSLLAGLGLDISISW